MSAPTRHTTNEPVPGFDDAHRPVDQPTITDPQALILAEHAIFVQGGYSTPERERERLLADLAGGAKMPDWSKLAAEVDDAKKLRAENPEAVSAGVDLRLVRRYKELRDLEAASSAEGKTFKEEADRIEARLVEQYSEAGVQNLSIDGKTVYLNRTTFAQWEPGLDPEEKRAALRAAGVPELVTETVNSQTLSAWVRELCDDDDAPGLPEPIKDLLQLGEKFNIRIQASGSRPKSKSRSKG